MRESSGGWRCVTGRSVTTTLALRGSFEGQGFPPLTLCTCIRVHVLVYMYMCVRAWQEDYEGVRREVAGVEVLVNEDVARGRLRCAWVVGGVCQGWRDPGAQYL